nr:hypothetical protein [Micromonospora sp. DSM 115978]
MTVLHIDSTVADEERRRKLFDGDLFVYSPTPHSAELAAFARRMAEQAFAPHHPPTAQHHLTGQSYVSVLADLKPAFINHPRCKELVRGVLADLGADLTRTYFDVPRLRTMTSDYLNAGLTLQFEPHRDTWFSAPLAQVNFWLPVYEVDQANVMAFHQRYFDVAVRNSSADYDYAEWVRHGRTAAAQQVTTETRPQPRPRQEIEREPELRVLTPPGGLLVFSGAHLHSTVPNTSGRTRFSIDFRAVHLADVETRTGARNVDSACRGSSLGDFLRAADLSPLPADLVRTYQAAGPGAPVSVPAPARPVPPGPRPRPSGGRS